MDDYLFMGIDNRFKVSVADSTMMCILHRAMNKAHERVRSKEGVIERLNEQSKFCELAIMQLEACLKFVQEEANNYTVLDNTTNYHKLISDLTEIKDRLCGRLKETELALAEKDKELVEKERALEEREDELRSLRISSREENERGGDFGELKNSVDQQVWNIKQHLEGERMALTRRMSQGSSTLDDSETFDVVNNYDVLSLSPNKICECRDGHFEAGFDQMGLEIDRLKETLDTAFGIMQSTASEPLEELQWTRAIENNVQSILFKGVLTDLQKDATLVTQESNIEQWLELMKDVESLRNELDGIVGLKSKDNSGEIAVKDEEELKKLPVNEGSEEDDSGGNLVARMTKRHESIIRTKSEELNWMRVVEMVREKSQLSPKKSKNSGNRDYIEKVVKRLDDFLKWKAKLDTLANRNIDGENEIFQIVLKETIRNMEGKFVTFKEMANSWLQAFEDRTIENLISRDVHCCVFIETMKGCCDLIKGYEDHIDHIKSSAAKTAKYAKLNGKESLIEKLDSLLSDMEIEDILMLSSEMEEEIKETADMVNTDDESSLEVDEVTFSDVSAELEKALRQLGSTKTLLKELAYIEDETASENGFQMVNDQKKYDIWSVDEDQSQQLSVKKIAAVEINAPQLGSLFNHQEVMENGHKMVLNLDLEHKMPSLSLITKKTDDLENKEVDFEIPSHQVINEEVLKFEGMLEQKLNLNNSRLQKMNDQVKPLIKHIALLKKKESVYKKAFITRCQNLKTAETEVDILADQVDSLTCLLERIYKTLDYYSPVLQHFSGVVDILTWIRKELNVGVVANAPNHGFLT